MLQASAFPAAAGAALPKLETTKSQIIPRSPLQPVKVVLVAFGFKLGVPEYIDFIFDVRSVPNPWKLNDFKVMMLRWRRGCCRQVWCRTPHDVSRCWTARTRVYKMLSCRCVRFLPPQTPLTHKQIRRAKTVLSQLRSPPSPFHHTLSLLNFCRRFVVDKVSRFVSSMSPAAAALVAQQAGVAADVPAEGTLTIGIGCRSSLQNKIQALNP